MQIRPNAPQSTPAAPKDRFAEFDKDKNGTISQGEYAPKPTGFCGTPYMMAVADFKKRDLDHDGKLTADEFKRTERAPKSKQPADPDAPKSLPPALEKGIKDLGKPLTLDKETSDKAIGFFKKALPFLFPVVGAGLLAKKGIEKTLEEGTGGVLKQLALTAASPVLGAVNFFKKLF
jgi:EF hand